MRYFNNRLHDLLNLLAAADELVEQALASPNQQSALYCELAKGKKNVVILASDHTRPVSQQGNHTSHAAGNKTV